MSVTASSLLAGFKPQFDRILVQKVVESIAPKSKGGILLPPETQNGPLVKAKVKSLQILPRDPSLHGTEPDLPIFLPEIRFSVWVSSFPLQPVSEGNVWFCLQVLAYGSGRRDATTGKVTPISEAIQKAKFIAFPTYSGFHFKSEEGDICLIREDEVVGVFNQ